MHQLRVELNSLFEERGGAEGFKDFLKETGVPGVPIFVPMVSAQEFTVGLYSNFTSVQTKGLKWIELRLFDPSEYDKGIDQIIQQFRNFEDQIFNCGTEFIVKTPMKIDVSTVSSKYDRLSEKGEPKFVSGNITADLTAHFLPVLVQYALLFSGWVWDSLGPNDPSKLVSIISTSGPSYLTVNERSSHNLEPKTSSCISLCTGSVRLKYIDYEIEGNPGERNTYVQVTFKVDSVMFV